MCEISGKIFPHYEISFLLLCLHNRRGEDFIIGGEYFSENLPPPPFMIDPDQHNMGGEDFQKSDVGTL